MAQGKDVLNLFFMMPLRHARKSALQGPLERIAGAHAAGRIVISALTRTGQGTVIRLYLSEGTLLVLLTAREPLAAIAKGYSLILILPKGSRA